MSFDIDASVADSSAAVNAAADQDKIEAIQNGDKIGATRGDEMPVKDWMSNLPKNVGVGVLDAASNTVDAAKVFGESAWNNLFRPSPAQRAVNESEGKTADGATMEDLREKFLAQPMVQETHGPIRQAYQAFRDELATGSTTSDEITQGIAQFAVPMLGWSKLLGVQKAISAGGFLAEGVTASTALAPHAGRNADLIQQGKAIEGKLGDALNAIAPDGSALNAYINYMTDRTGESDAEGRFKNVIDSMVTTTAGAALLKTGATALKVGMSLPGYIADTAGTGPAAGSAAAQAGKIVFHGTPHDFDTFSNDKIGTGEGNQSYGHGLYFAENQSTAGHYQSALVRRGVRPGSPMDHALQAVNSAGGDEKVAYQQLTQAAAKAPDAEYRQVLTNAAGVVKSGNAARRGALMHVDIPDEHIGNMLDHDSTMDEQPNILSKIPAADRIQLEQVLEDHNQDGELEDYKGGQFRQIVERAINEGYLITPSDTGHAPADAASYLSSKGIPGIKYLDRESRSSSKGTRNIVLFDAKHAKIVKKE